MIPCFLTLPGEGARTSGRIIRKVRLLALRHLLTVNARELGDVAASMATLHRVLAVAVKRDSKRVLAAVGSPDVLPWLLVSIEGFRPIEQCIRAAVPSLLATLSTLPEAVLWDAEVAELSDGERFWTLSPPAKGVQVDPSGVTLRLADGAFAGLDDLPGASHHLLLRGGVRLALRDRFPLAMVEDHPEKQGNAFDLGERPEREWVDALSAALVLIEEGLPAWYSELPLTLSRLVPVGFEEKLHLSASYREAPGMAYLTLHPNPLTLAEAVIHETQHGKLNALTWLDKVLINGRSFWTTSPVRPDERPIMGVLLAVHAFVPVAALHCALAERDWPDAHFFLRRRREVLASNERGLRVLEAHSQPTELGSRLLADLRALHDHLVAASGDLIDVASITSL